MSSTYKTKITKLRRNPTLKVSDKGACRRYISRINKQADKLFGDSLPLPSLQTLTDTSVEIVNNIHKRRNSALSPSLWSPIASLLSLRCSALGSSIRLGFDSHSTPLKRLITNLSRDERKIILNDEEVEWLSNNFFQIEPYEWNEGRNEFSFTPHAVKELVRTRELLTKANRLEFRRIHGGRMCKLQEAADAGCIDRILKTIVGQDPSFLMESLRHGETTITDGAVIHEHITSFFSKWFQRLPNEKRRDKLLADCLINCDRLRWDALTSDIGIPSNTSDTLWNAFQPKHISDQGRRESESLLTYFPSYDDFLAYIRRLDPNSAPGDTGKVDF
jgi:hypothetical protein